MVSHRSGTRGGPAHAAPALSPARMLDLRRAGGCAGRAHQRRAPPDARAGPGRRRPGRDPPAGPAGPAAPGPGQRPGLPEGRQRDAGGRPRGRRRCLGSAGRALQRLLAATRELADSCRLDPAADLGIGSVHVPELDVLFPAGRPGDGPRADPQAHPASAQAGWPTGCCVHRCQAALDARYTTARTAPASAPSGSRRSWRPSRRWATAATS